MGPHANNQLESLLAVGRDLDQVRRRLHRHPDQFSYNPLILAEHDRRHFAPPGRLDLRTADFTYERLENAHPSGGEAALAAFANRPSPENRGAGSPIARTTREPIRVNRQNPMFPRRGWDSNPRKPCGFSGFQDRRIRPLCHPSGAMIMLVLSLSRVTSCPIGSASRRYHPTRHHRPPDPSKFRPNTIAGCGSFWLTMKHAQPSLAAPAYNVVPNLGLGSTQKGLAYSAPWDEMILKS